MLTAGGRPPAPGATITLQRTVVDDDSSETVKLPPVSTNADGSAS